VIKVFSVKTILAKSNDSTFGADLGLNKRFYEIYFGTPMFFPLSGFTLMKGCRSKAAPANNKKMRIFIHREVHVEHLRVVLWGFAG